MSKRQSFITLEKMYGILLIVTGILWWVYMGCNSRAVIYLYRGSRNFTYVPPRGKAFKKCSSCDSR